jgi:hypothetical protein
VRPEERSKLAAQRHGREAGTPVKIDRSETFLIPPRWLFCRVRVRHRRDHNGRAFAMDVIVLV